MRETKIVVFQAIRCNGIQLSQIGYINRDFCSVMVVGTDNIKKRKGGYVTRCCQLASLCLICGCVMKIP
jgi:hypothetical protein